VKLGVTGASAVGTEIFVLGAEPPPGTALQKGLALGQVAIDTATSISSLMAVSEANPLNTLTFGGAGIAQYAAGINSSLYFFFNNSNSSLTALRLASNLASSFS